MTILRAWIVLVVASAASTALAFVHARGMAVAAVLLALALVKSRVILSDYLRLREAPPFRLGFMVALVAWAGISFALVAAASLR